MAWTFGDEIKVLTGYDAMGSGDSVSGEDFYLHTNQWLKDAAKEVIHILPPKLKEKCTTETTLNNSATTMDMDGVGEILYVNRLSADSGGSRIPCRKIQSMYGELANDLNSLYKASATDPVYWILSSSDASILNVIPTPTANQTALVYHVGYPSPANFHDETTIANFPDEAEYLVVLRAAVTAAQHLLAIEEDVELYGPVLTTLKQQYQEGVLALQTGSPIPQQKGGQQ
jgi:hypothetical protein